MTENNKSTKICFILPTLEGGGIERIVTNLSDYFVSKGHQVSILLLFKVPGNFFVHDVRIQIFEPEIDRKKNNKYIYALYLIPYIRKTLIKINPDVIVSHGEWSNAYVVLANAGLKYPLYLEDHMNPDLNLGLLLNTAKKLLYRYADGIIALTNYAATRIKKQTKAKNIVVIPNPINLPEPLPSVKSNSIITIGRLSKEKGHKFLIEAFGRINRKDWILEIVGDGPEKNYLQKLSSKFDIKENIVFHGYQKDIVSYLSKARIFVLPSLSECFPIALIEAMSMRLACISSDCMAGKEILVRDNVNGLLVEPGNIDSLSESLLRVMDDPCLRETISNEAYKIREVLDFETICSRYLDFITAKH